MRRWVVVVGVDIWVEVEMDGWLWWEYAVMVGLVISMKGEMWYFFIALCLSADVLSGDYLLGSMRKDLMDS